MKVSIVNEKHNPYLKRKELAVHIEHENEPTPQREALQQYLAKELNTEAEKIEVKSIFTDFGVPKSKAKIFAWEEKIIKQEKKPEKEKKSKEAEAEKEEKSAAKDEQTKETS